jgi:amidophosphoribosyltransferase
MTCGNDISHRGDQAWGILTSDGKKTAHYHQEGRFNEGITEAKAISLGKRLAGSFGLVHTLYSTIGKSGQKKQPKTFQPLTASFHGETFGLSFNGNVYDLSDLRANAEKAGWPFESDISDTEVIVASLATSKKIDFIEALKEVLPQLKGAFALVFSYRDKIIGVRDRCGIRPLCVGVGEDCFVISSESCAFYPIGAKFVREVRPGEIVVIGSKGIERFIRWIDESCCRFCVFEFVYFARPDSRLCGNRSAYYYRNKAGLVLAKEAPVDADLIISVPAGGDIFADAYASELRIPLRQGLFKNRFGVRTFMTPRGTDRRKLQRIKLHPLSEVIWGKKICLVEDSIVRNNVAHETAQMCYEAGAKEVHIRVFSAPIIAPCYYGIDMSTNGELVAAKYSVEQIREQAGVDSLAYISMEGMIESTGLRKEDLCLACFNGDYPVHPPTEII